MLADEAGVLAVTRMFVAAVVPVRVTDVAEALVTVPPSFRLSVARVTDGPVSFRSPAMDTEPDCRLPLRVVKKSPVTSKLFSPWIPDMNRPPAPMLQLVTQEETRTLSPVKSRVLLSRTRLLPFTKYFRMPAGSTVGVMVVVINAVVGWMTVGTCSTEGVAPAVALALT